MDEVHLEHRLTEMQVKLDAIEAALRTGTIEITGMKLELRTNTQTTAALEHQIARQNGRVSDLERWAQERKVQIARAVGELEGRTGLSKGQWAVLGVLAPATFAGLDMLLRLLA